MLSHIVSFDLQTNPKKYYCSIVLDEETDSKGLGV